MPQYLELKLVPKIGEILIYDTFIFFNELDLLEIRLNILDQFVDKFVLVEATKTFQGNPKPLYFDENKSRFAKFNHKIIHVIVDDVPIKATTWEREYFQRESILRGLSACAETDLVLISDLDEIPNPEVIPTNFVKKTIGVFRQKLFYYKLDTKCVEQQNLPWSLIVSFDPSISPAKLRKRLVETQSAVLTNSEIGDDIQIIENGGWHFSYLGSPKQIVEKIEAFSHDELNRDQFKNIDNIQSSIVEGRDIFGRSLSFSVASAGELPQYVIDNAAEYRRKGMMGATMVEQSPYKYSFDPKGDSTAAKVIRMVGENKSVLELGCAYGVMTKVLVEKNGCSVHAVEIDEATAESARPYCEKLIVANLESLNWDGLFEGKKFDVIVAADVLEHLHDPDRLLNEMRKHLLPKGFIVLSVPNISYNGVIAELLDEDFNYRKTGLLDQTHLHFFSFRSLLRAIEKAGHHIVELERTIMSVEASEFGDAWNKLPGWLAGTLKSRPEGEVYQYVVKITPWRVIKNLDHNVVPEIRSLNASVAEITKQISIERDAAIAEREIQKLKLEELSSWGVAQHATIVERDALIRSLNKELQDASEWGKTLQGAVEERDILIGSLNKKIVAQEKALSDKQAELMKMSDWAQGMMLEIKRRNIPIYSGMLTFARRVAGFLRRKLAHSFVGDLVRYGRDVWSWRKKRVSLDAIRQSVIENNGRLIITFPIITWNFRWQRPQHIVSRLRDRGFSVLYVAMSMSPLGRRLRNTKEALSLLSFNELSPSVNKIWLNSSKQINIYTDPIEDEDLHNICMGLEALISELRPKSVIYLIQFPGWGPVALGLRSKLGGKVIFDCMDDHGGFSTNTQQALKTEESLIQNADLVITSSHVLEEKAKVLNPNAIQVKNGTEFEHFANPTPNGKLDHLRDRPIIGYYGAISDWFDMEIVAHCARHRPDWNFVLVGSTVGADLQPIANLKNMHLLGEIPYKELPGYFAYFDVCTIPFKIIPLTLATNPVKFYEYLSAGKPVVSVALPELLPYQDDCYLARNAEEFLLQLDRAFNERQDEEKIKRRKTLASNNSWDARVNTILESEIFKTYLQSRKS